MVLKNLSPQLYKEGEILFLDGGVPSEMLQKLEEHLPGPFVDDVRLRFGSVKAPKISHGIYDGGESAGMRVRNLFGQVSDKLKTFAPGFVLTQETKNALERSRAIPWQLRHHLTTGTARDGNKVGQEVDSGEALRLTTLLPGLTHGVSYRFDCHLVKSNYLEGMNGEALTISSSFHPYFLPIVDVALKAGTEPGVEPLHFDRLRQIFESVIKSGGDRKQFDPTQLFKFGKFSQLDFSRRKVIPNGYEPASPLHFELFVEGPPRVRFNIECSRNCTTSGVERKETFLNFEFRLAGPPPKIEWEAPQGIDIVQRLEETHVPDGLVSRRNKIEEAEFKDTAMDYNTMHTL